MAALMLMKTTEAIVTYRKVSCQSSELTRHRAEVTANSPMTRIRLTRSLGCVRNLCPKTAFNSMIVTFGTIDAAET